MVNALIKILSAIIIGIVAAVIYIFRNVFNYSDDQLFPIVKTLLAISLVLTVLFIYYLKSKLFSTLNSLINKIIGILQKRIGS